MVPDLKGIGVLLWAGFITILLCSMGILFGIGYGIYRLISLLF